MSFPLRLQQLLKDLGISNPVRTPFLSSPPDIAIVTLPDSTSRDKAVDLIKGHVVDGKTLIADPGPPAEAPAEVEAKAMGGTGGDGGRGGGGGRGRSPAGRGGGRGGRGGGQGRDSRGQGGSKRARH